MFIRNVPSFMVTRSISVPLQVYFFDKCKKNLYRRALPKSFFPPPGHLVYCAFFLNDLLVPFHAGTGFGFEQKEQFR